MGNPFGLVIAGFIGGIIFFFKGLFKWKEKRLIENTPTSKIRSLAMGRVEVYGSVLPIKGQLMKAPFSGKDCVYCKWTVEEYRRAGKHSRWVTLKQGLVGQHFVIKDDSGEVLVDPTGADVDIPLDFEAKSFTPGVTKFLALQNIAYQGWLFNKQMRFREYFLAKGDKVYIMGFAGDNPFVKEGTGTKNQTDIMIQANGKQFYYITDKPEAEVLKKMNWVIYGGLIGGAALILVCLAIAFWLFKIL